MENWRFIEENPDYMISDHGRVLSFKGRSKLILCAKIMGTGYETVILPNKGVCIEYKIHRLVAKAFIPNPEQLPQINHLDGNTMNNHVSNLEWCDAYTNMMHAIRTGLRRTGVGSHQTPFAVIGCNGESIACLPVYERNGQRGTSEACAPKLAYPPTKASGPRETTRLACATSSGRCFYYGSDKA